MSVNEKMTAIADNIRAHTGGTEPLTLDGMAAGVEEVFDAGKQAEYDRFWDVFQNNGNPTNYNYHFSYDGWTDENFNPKYPLVCKTGATPGMALFYGNVAITDTKVPIEVQGSSAQAMFLNASNLVTIRKLTVHESVTFQNTFQSCTALVNLTMDGEIGKDINFQWSSKLSAESAKSIIQHLKDYTGTSNEDAYTVRFHDNVWTALEAEGNAAPHGGTWKDYVDTLGWNI